MTDKMHFCARHEALLVDAFEMRGLDDAAIERGRQAIVTHATNFAGAAALRMLRGQHCPLCFVNRNPAGVNLDGWVHDAAREQRTQGATPPSPPQATLVN